MLWFINPIQTPKQGHNQKISKIKNNQREQTTNNRQKKKGSVFVCWFAAFLFFLVICVLFCMLSKVFSCFPAYDSDPSPSCPNISLILSVFLFAFNCCIVFWGVDCFVCGLLFSQYKSWIATNTVKHSWKLHITDHGCCSWRTMAMSPEQYCDMWGNPTVTISHSCCPKSSSTPQWPFEASEDSSHLTTFFRLRTCDTHRLLAPRTTKFADPEEQSPTRGLFHSCFSVPQQKPPATSLAAGPIPHAVDWPRSRSPKQRGWSQEVVGSSLGWPRRRPKHD